MEDPLPVHYANYLSIGQRKLSGACVKLYRRRAPLRPMARRLHELWRGTPYATLPGSRIQVPVVSFVWSETLCAGWTRSPQSVRKTRFHGMVGNCSSLQIAERWALHSIRWVDRSRSDHEMLAALRRAGANKNMFQRRFKP